MEQWLQESLELVHRSFEDITYINYKNLIYVFYEHFSNRNLAEFLAILYDKDKIEMYVEIDKVIARKDYDIYAVQKIIDILNQHGFQEWLEEDF